MLSIIVPHYCTRKEYFDKCIGSLLKDKEADIEVLIIDDGSSAEYRANLERYEKNPKVRCLYEQHKGVSHARNVGIMESKGEWLMFVDSDDYLEDGYYAILADRLKDTDADFIIFNGYGDKNGSQIKNIFFVKENVDYAATMEKKCQVMGAGLSLGRTPKYLRCYYTLGAPVSKIIKTSFLKKHHLYFDENLKFAEDTMFSMNLVLNAEHIYYADVYLYHYYMNQESVTGKYRQGLSDDVFFFLNRVDDFMEENNLRNELEESYYIRAFLEAQRCVRQEFYHKQNPAGRRQRHLSASLYLKQKVYKTAFDVKYPYMMTKPCKIATLLLRNEYYSLYMRMYDLLNLSKRLIKKS